MAEIMRMPEVLAGAAEAAIQTWLVQPGDTVTRQQPLAEIETEKAIVELPAEADGVVGRLLVPEGNSVAVGDPILILLAAGESMDAIGAAGPPAGSPAGRRLFVSPLVRRLAAQHDVDLGEIAGTGPNGRIVRRDLQRYLERATLVAAAPAAPARSVPPAPAAAYEDIPLDRMRQAIARRLSESKSTVPHFYLVADCRVDALLEIRTQVNAIAPRNISVNDFVLKAVAAALTDLPVANAIWNGDSIRRFSTVDLSVAVATDAGLMTPVLRGVERMPLSQVSATVAELAARARGGRLKQHELEGGSFCVSNLGMYGTQQFSAILNPPQSGILAVGAARKAPIVDAGGAVTTGSVLTVTLSADHRVLDGAVAAQWLSAFQHRIENPISILI